MQSIQSSIIDALGLHSSPEELGFGQMLLRALVISAGLLAMIRLAGRRFLARRNPFDALLGFVVASILSRAVNGPAPFFATLGTGFALAIAYRLFAWWAAKSHSFGRFLKGNPQRLIDNGVVDQAVMDRHQLSHRDLMEDLRLNAALDDVKEVKVAHIERNGEISIQRKPEAFTVGVEKGVQTIRIEVET